MPIPNNSRVSVSELRERFVYDPATGAITWRWHRQSTRIGADAGTVNSVNGYTYLSLGVVKLLAHRVAWALTYGEHPEQQVDHINGDKTDNRLANLRAAHQGQNGANSRTRSHNRCGVKGVQETRSGRFMALISKNQKQRYLGTFSTPEEAHDAYMEWAAKLHGEFACGGVR